MPEAIAQIASLTDLALLAALASTRIAIAFLLLPVLASDTVPAMVRSAIFLSFGMITLAMQPAISVNDWSTGEWLGLFVKEAMIGLAMGMLLAAVLWAFHAAGEIVDGATGMSMAQIVDPLSGRTTSLSGAILGRLAVFVFMAYGGMALWVGVLIESFAMWPMASTNLAPNTAGVQVFETAFASFANLTFMLAAPVLVVVYLIDLSLGVMNRYAPQLNLLSISSSLKGLAAVLVWVLIVTVVAQSLHEEVVKVLSSMLSTVKTLLR